MDSNLNWYIIRTLSNKEKFIFDKIKNDTYISNFIEEIIIPTEKVFSFKNNKKITKDKILFPGYVFVQTSSLSELKEFLKNISGTPGFLTSRSGEVQIVKDKEMQSIIETQKKSKEKSIDDVFLVGQIVKITEGPFSNMVGTIEEINGNKVKLSISIFDRKTSIDLDINQIK